jgi:hypothetical protein
LATDALDALEAALLAERAALAASDIAALEAALDAKASAIAELSRDAATAVDRERLLRLQALNAEVEARVNVAIAATARRLGMLTGADAGVYAADGHLEARRSRGTVATA